MSSRGTIDDDGKAPVDGSLATVGGVSAPICICNEPRLLNIIRRFAQHDASAQSFPLPATSFSLPIIVRTTMSVRWNPCSVIFFGYSPRKNSQPEPVDLSRFQFDRPINQFQELRVTSERGD